ncbi:hypothetical protein ACFSSA_14060 [Luteolibacter algae]|uniref:Uncharacterized protein n=1 Tax=Luteolibacter algae TaxID=454151 RepID=A0ABW5DA46_9BACT
MFRVILPSLFLSLFLQSAPAAQVWQPIIDYTISFPGDRPDAAPIINPFENFTHFASDFGWMGPGGARIDSRNGVIHVRPDGEWTGAWHSLAGLAADSSRTLDPTDLVGLQAPRERRTGIRALSVNASGFGSLRLELADVNREIIWSNTLELATQHTIASALPIPSHLTKRIKFMNWIAEPGAELRISSIGFLAERPEMSPEEWAFRISLGKIRRCHDPDSGFTRDRGHLPAGVFDSIASTGYHALCSALGAAEGILDREAVSAEIERTIKAIRKLPKSHGFLPHFVSKGESGRISIHPGTEFSTVDTAISLQALLLATEILGRTDLQEEVGGMIADLDFPGATDTDGWITHGFLDDGHTMLAGRWRDWGGETALVLALQAMTPGGKSAIPKMTNSGEVYRGVGFIAEIQSLLYPDFDKTDKDLISSISWPEARKALLADQIAYFQQSAPETSAAKQGVFGVSAGEAGMPGAGYTANGTEVIGVRWIHPHYMLMGLALSGGELYHAGLERLDAIGMLYPLGLPENTEVDLRLHNPMQGSLNASFETLAAYHGWRGRSTEKNLLDQASKKCSYTREAAAIFYAQ